MSLPVLPDPLDDSIQLLIAGYVLGDLSPEEAAEFEQLLSERPELAHEVAQVQHALELSFAAPEVAPPAHLRHRVLQFAQSPTAGASVPDSIPMDQDALSAEGRVRAVSPDRSSDISSRRPSRWRSFWGIHPLGIVAAALIIALGITNYRLWTTVQQLQQTQIDPASRTNRLNYSLEGTDLSQGSIATLSVDPSTLKATLTTQNLPPLPPGKVYALWTLVEPTAPFTTDAKGAILTEVFAVGTQEQFEGTISVPDVYRTPDWITRVAITIEEENAPQAHTGQAALITPL